MRCRCEESSFHIGFPERAERIDDKDIRIQIQDAVQLFGEEKRRQQAVIHFTGILSADRCIGKSSTVDHERMEFVSHYGALPGDGFQIFLRDTAVHQPDICLLLRLADADGGKKHLKPGQIGPVQGGQDLNTVHLSVPDAAYDIVILFHLIHLDISPLNFVTESLVKD